MFKLWFCFVYGTKVLYLIRKFCICYETFVSFTKVLYLLQKFCIFYKSFVSLTKVFFFYKNLYLLQKFVSFTIVLYIIQTFFLSDTKVNVLYWRKNATMQNETRDSPIKLLFCDAKVSHLSYDTKVFKVKRYKSPMLYCHTT